MDKDLTFKDVTIGLLVGGGLGATVLKDLLGKIQIKFVLTDDESTEIKTCLAANQIVSYTGNPRGGRALQKLKSMGSTTHVDFLISVNYRYLIESDLISLPRYPAMNLHGSLLPLYRGRAPLIWAIINGERSTGITVHQIDEGCDTGPILLQRAVDIPHNATGADMVRRYTLIYPELVREAINLSISNNLMPEAQDESLATYYGKRSPEDGRIRWFWSKERIRNWVRALAWPYPGAFFNIEDNKIIVNRASAVDVACPMGCQEGTIIDSSDGDKIWFKVSDGVVALDDIVAPKNTLLRVGMVLD